MAEPDDPPPPGGGPPEDGPHDPPAPRSPLHEPIIFFPDDMLTPAPDDVAAAPSAAPEFEDPPAENPAPEPIAVETEPAPEDEIVAAPAAEEEVAIEAEPPEPEPFIAAELEPESAPIAEPALEPEPIPEAAPEPVVVTAPEPEPDQYAEPAFDTPAPEPLSEPEPEPLIAAAREPDPEPDPAPAPLEPAPIAVLAAPDSEPEPEPEPIALAPELASEPAPVPEAEPEPEPAVTLTALFTPTAPEAAPEPALEETALEEPAPEPEPAPVALAAPDEHPAPVHEESAEPALFDEPAPAEEAPALFEAAPPELEPAEELFDESPAPPATQPYEWIVESAHEPGARAIEEVEAEIVPRSPAVFVPAAPAPEDSAQDDEPEAIAAPEPERVDATALTFDPPPPQPSLRDRLNAQRVAITAALAARVEALREKLKKRDEDDDDRGDGDGRHSFEEWGLPRFNPPGPPTWRGVALAAGGTMVLFVVLIAGFFIYVTWGMPSTKDLWAAKDVPSLTFVDRHGRVIIREGAQNAPPTDLKKLPDYVTEAVVAIEDRRFYEHWGVDINGLMRASAANMKAGRVVQGGSTLTQQLAKNLFLTNQRSFRRKAQEIALAFWLESQFSKDEILALYLSRVYFGAGAWGIEAASERYFDKPARQLTLAEAALLAGLLKAPSRLNPASQDTAAKARAKIVLDEMLSAGFITPKEHSAALKAPLSISRSNPNGNLGYFRDWIDPQLNQIIGDQRDDFIIETTLDLEAQRAGERVVDHYLATEGKLKNVHQGALLALDSEGGVRTMVGGRSYGKNEGQSEFNRTTQSRRQPGSSFKFFIYAAAMATGNYSPWTVRVDEPITIGDWSPGNYEDKYNGAVTLSSAYASSMNMVAILIAHEVGGDKVIEMAQKLGVKTKLYNYRSLALGAQGLPLIEMTTAYGAMANDGIPITPHGIARVKRSNGQVVWAFREKKTEPALDQRTLRLMNFLGNRVIQAGTGTKARIPERQIAGKTGTGNDYRDAWFIGYVPGLVAGVWVGNDDFSETKKVTGGSIPTQIWHDFMVVAVRDTPFKPLAMPRDEDMPQPDVVDAGAVMDNAKPVNSEAIPYDPYKIVPAIPFEGGDG